MDAQTTHDRVSGAKAPIPPAAAPHAPAAAPTAAPVVKKTSAKKIIIYTILLAAAVFGLIYGYNLYSFSRTHVSTDNAQIDGHIDPVLPHVAGYVTSVTVNDNDKVTEGQPIIEIDAREFQIKLDNAEAALRTAQVGLETARASQHNAEAALAVAKANVATAQVASAKTTNDLNRDKNLLQGGAITRQQYDATKSAYDAAAAQLETARRQVGVAQAQVEVSSSQVQAAQSQVTQRSNDVDFAKLQLSYTKIAAPAAGIVSKKNVEVGQFVQSGQPLLSITQDSTVWVTANFKETDLDRLKVGAPVEIEVDGYPDIKFSGKVASIAPTTGAKQSLLPPDNATGNFVKVTQRVPVKIFLTDRPDPQYALRPGMSADVTVSTK
jgi:membrane fusion protein (multidrug efflux system)